MSRRWRTAARWAGGWATGATLLLVPVSGQQSPPVFRSATSIVSVDVIVRDASGNIVRGLTAADFTVLEDGKPQRIDAFNAVRRKWDPEGRLKSAQSVRVLGDPR